ncbi:MAG: restriction endonuclease [Oscillospiraceae bacterium]|nr:restriction endonuclease [Oscillospiraceae bacterium]
MNKLYYGDNLDILRRYIRDESVDLCYIDPPFNSKRNYNQIYNNIGKEDRAQSIAFVDTWEWNIRAETELDEICMNKSGAFTAQTSDLIIGLERILGKGSLLAYLVSMTLRINEIHRVLKPAGSFYLHCDPTVGHYLKIVLDAVFCGQDGDFLNEIVWCYRQGGRSGNNFGKKHDTIFLYTKSNTWTFNSDPIRVPYEGTGGYQTSGKGVTTKTGKTYKPNELGKIPENWWDIPALPPMAKERLGYPTQKPEALLERIIKASSNEGDVVLDAYCGCGTTVAVAQRLKRAWIGIDISYQSISLILRRLRAYGQSVMSRIEENGIPADMESAKALALKKDDRLRKEFEKWAILTYSNNQAMINEKKGKDYGVDGKARIQEEKGQYKDVLFSVKSGKVSSPMIREFRGTIEANNAAAGIFITLQEPTKDMIKEAALAGAYKNIHMPRAVEKIKIVTIEQILNKERLSIPLTEEVLKKAQITGEDAEQLTL